MEIHYIDITELIEYFKEVSNPQQTTNVNQKEYLNQFFEKTNQQFQGLQLMDQINFNQVSNHDTSKLIKDETKDYSDTASLSLINDQQQLDFKNYLDWQTVLEKYGDFFQPASYYRTYIRANKFDNILNDIKPFEIIQDQTRLYLGYNGWFKQWIVIKEQEICNNTLLETAQQYLIHHHIYTLYPQIFLQIFSPIYVEVDQFDKTKFISQLEYGKINLYTYSLQNQLKDDEFQLIFQQLYLQIKLLHKHNIAHRDIKPQNIIFVENKGWVLCDFEDSIQYDNVNGIYSIRGTYAFLQAYLQRQSKIQSVLIKQNLLENDLYALAITLIVIKYQIKNQTEISEYIGSKNLIINTLINTPEFGSIDKIINQEQSSYVQPQVYQVQTKQNVQDISINEFVGYISILLNQNFSIKISDNTQTKIIDIINQKLALKDDYYNYINILCYVRIPGYLKYFKNLISYKLLRQPKYWRNTFKKINYSNNLEFIVNQIKFMDALGLTELTYEFAQFYLQYNYDFSIQLIIIRLLLHFNHRDKAQQQLHQIFSFRSFKQMTQEQLYQLIELTLNNFSWDIISGEDINFFKKIGIKGEYYEIPKILQEDISDQNFINKSIYNLREYLSQKQSQGIGSTFQYIEQTFILKNIQVSLMFIEQLAKIHLKYCCTTYDWQKLIQFQIDIQREIGNKGRVKQLTKKMNYILMFNSESSSQQKILKLIKFNTQTNLLKSKGISEKIFKQLRLVINNYDQLSVQYYKQILFSEITLMLQKISFSTSRSGNNLKQHFQILCFIFSKKNIFQSLKEENKIQFLELMIFMYQITVNNKRCHELLKNQPKLIKKEQRASVNDRRNQIQFWLDNQRHTKLTKIFVINQYFERH